MPANYTSLSQIVATVAPECQPISVPAHPAVNDATWMPPACASRTSARVVGVGVVPFQFGGKQLARLEVTIDALRVYKEAL